VRPAIDAQRQTLQVALPDVPLSVFGDQVRLAQVLANLLDNASKFTPPAGMIRVAAAADGDAVVLSVADSGIGVPADLLPRIFEPFVQADRTLERSRGGLGIGLTLVRTIVELHGGTVTAQSGGAGHGTEFVVRLPAAAAPARPAPVPPAVTAAAPGRQRILIVDDNVDAADSLALLLGAGGHEVATAYAGPDAVARADAWQPDLVVLDIGLPGMSGYEVAAHLCQRGDSRPGLIAVTGYGQAADADRARAAGFDEHLVKPVDAAVIESAIARCAAARATRVASTSTPASPSS
jgi:CheY-like chemotaxis protein